MMTTARRSCAMTAATIGVALLVLATAPAALAEDRGVPMNQTIKPLPQAIKNVTVIPYGQRVNVSFKLVQQAVPVVTVSGSNGPIQTATGQSPAWDWDLWVKPLAPDTSYSLTIEAPKVTEPGDVFYSTSFKTLVKKATVTLQNLVIKDDSDPDGCGEFAMDFVPTWFGPERWFSACDNDVTNFPPISVTFPFKGVWSYTWPIELTDDDSSIFCGGCEESAHVPISPYYGVPVDQDTAHHEDHVYMYGQYDGDVAAWAWIMVDVWFECG